jgi:hypothetical protein
MKKAPVVFRPELFFVEGNLSSQTARDVREEHIHLHRAGEIIAINCVISSELR